MMSAILPIQIRAIRVNDNDNSNIVSQFQGQTARFDQMPFTAPSNAASTGDKIYTPLTDPITESPANPLGAGIHLHWELPAYFRKGQQCNITQTLIFPPAPNRWLVTRYFSIFDTTTQEYQAATAMQWVVESDYLSTALQPSQPAISVPLAPQQGGLPGQPYMYMGRVVEYSNWDPASENSSNYLPAYTDSNGNPLYLTSVGFVGPHFSSYYPECYGVFGFWDNFSDIQFSTTQTLYQAIQSNTALQFRAMYHVVGWIQDTTQDPLNNIETLVSSEYQSYLNRCKAKDVPVNLTPASFFSQMMTEKMKWSYNAADISYELNPDQSIQSLNIPTQTLCSGILQEIVWNMGEEPSTTYFLANPSPSPGDSSALWTTAGTLSIGNTTQEAVSALLKSELSASIQEPTSLQNVEILLDALQTGLLTSIDNNTVGALSTFYEDLHQSGFRAYHGGNVWSIQNNKDPNDRVMLSLNLAEQLSLLNTAQKTYDTALQGLLTMQKQLFMDWYQYIQLYCQGTDTSFINTLSTFLIEASGSELSDIQQAQQSLGILEYTYADGLITGLSQPSGTTSSAYAVWQAYQTLSTSISTFNSSKSTQLSIICESAPKFYEPTEPVLLMESDALKASQFRFEDSQMIRMSPDILSQINVTYQNYNFNIETSQITVIPVINSSTPMQDDVQALVSEVFLLVPMLAPYCSQALQAVKGQPGTQPVIPPSDLILSLMIAQGGLSPLDIAPTPGGIQPTTQIGLFSTSRQNNGQPVLNQTISITNPITIAYEFTNASSTAWAPDLQGWATQMAEPSLCASRMDPFIPLFIVWTIELNPLVQMGNPTYSSNNLTNYFDLGTDSIDYQYLMDKDGPVAFVSDNPVNYSYSTIISRNAAGVLCHEINRFLSQHPNDPASTILQDAVTNLSAKPLISQALGHFNEQQILTNPIAAVPVQDLVNGPRDMVTSLIGTAASSGNWYTYGFNASSPISYGLLAQNNFGPLRSGFLTVNNIEIVDVFGQRMDFKKSKAGTLSCAPAFTLAPNPDDTQHTSDIYLPPRVLTPTRLWFRWLSATFNTQVSGIDSDFIEMSDHAASSPIFGWVLPNNLENSLFLYDHHGNAIGSFGIEDSSETPSLVYRTRPGNTANPTNSLAIDIGSAGSPVVNPHLANWMWYLDGQTVAFFNDLMASIQQSAEFIHPSNYAESISLSVLIGRPLALSRAVIQLETWGGLLPLSQDSSTSNSAFPQDVTNSRYQYTDRMNYSSANLSAVEFPVVLGAVNNINDGLVGYIIEGDTTNPYTGTSFYSPAANSQMDSGVLLPDLTTLPLTLNSPSTVVTMLLDPRCSVHATTGILPMNKLSIPSHHYVNSMNNISVTFTTLPVLSMANALSLPLPKENGYNWGWISGAGGTTPLKAGPVEEKPFEGYSPQTVMEGWLSLNRQD